MEGVDNLVVVLSTPNLFQLGATGIPAGAGYRLGFGLSPVPLGTPATAWLRFTVCAGTALNKFAEYLPASATTGLAWPVSINGKSSATCNAPPCLGDFNGDGVRNGADLATLLSAWGTAGGDINGDGTTNGADLAVLLSGWGTCPI